GRGSVFTLFMPRSYTPVAQRLAASVRLVPVTSARALSPTPQTAIALAPAPRPASPDDDRDQVEPGDRVLLAIEDDIPFATLVMEAARAHGFKVVLATEGDAGLTLARKLHPSAISLDLRLPDIDGWTVLDQLKHDAGTRHIPVAIISADDQRPRGIKMGALDYITKPASTEAISATLDGVATFVADARRRLLVVEDDEAARQSIAALLGLP